MTDYFVEDSQGGIIFFDPVRIRLFSLIKAGDQEQTPEDHPLPDEASSEQACGYGCGEDDLHPVFLPEKQAAKRKKVYPWKMDTPDRAKFDMERATEWANITSANAVTFLSPTQAAKIRETCPDRILASRHCYSWKSTDDGQKATC